MRISGAVNAEAEDILTGSNAFSSYKGSFTEEFIATEFFSTIGEKLYYYTNDNSTLVISFVAEFDKVYPIEVKAETNTKSKSISTVIKKYESLTGIRFFYVTIYQTRENSQRSTLSCVKLYGVYEA